MAKGERELKERCQKLSNDQVAGLFYMVLGGMTQLEVWPLYRDVVERMLPTWEEEKVTDIGALIDQDT